MKKILIIFIIIVLASSAGVAVGGYLALAKGVPQIEEIKDYKPTTGTKVYADDDIFIGEFKVEKGIYTPLKKIPVHLINAVIATEDSRFWTHKGVDYIAITRALLKDTLALRIKEGGSTITQQLTKVLFLTPKKTVQRKLREVILAYRLEKNLTKEEILELYLNRIYLGHGAYGVEMAARTYFGKSVSDINLSEAALLAGIIKAPSSYSPYNNLVKAKERQYVVLKRMQEEGYITEKDVKETYARPLYLSSLKYGYESPNYFLEYIRKYLEEKYGAETVYKGALRVYTTLHRGMQTAAVNTLQTGLRDTDKRQGFRGPIGHKDMDIDLGKLTEKEAFPKVIMKPDEILMGIVIKVLPGEAVVKAGGIVGKILLSDSLWASRLIDQRGNIIKVFKKFKLTDILKSGDIIKVRLKLPKLKETLFLLEQEPLVEGAVVAMEPSTGYIRAMVGGYDFQRSEFNRAVFARRQAGSAFKPIIYGSAMDHGFTPASIIIDEPVSYSAGLIGDWKPENYDHEYWGPTRLREALAYSRNIVTVKLLEKVGVENVIELAKRLGFEGPFPNDLTLALGSLSVSPLEMTSTFSAFANEGIKMKPIAIKYITDFRGEVLEQNEPEGVEAISPQTAFLITSLLEDVVKYGTGWRAKAIGGPVAGKTGTSNEYKDAWFVGYTPELTAGVWVGFDNMRSLGHGETGAMAASPIWVSFMKEVLSASQDTMLGFEGFRMPEGIKTTEIDPNTGLLSTDKTEKMVEFFKEGTAPQTYSRPSHIDIKKKERKNLDLD